MGIEHEYDHYGAMLLCGLHQDDLRDAISEALRDIVSVPDTVASTVFCVDWDEWYANAIQELRLVHNFPVGRVIGWPRMFKTVAAVINEAQQRAGFLLVE